MQNSDLPENFEVVQLGDAIAHPLFNPALRDVVLAMAAGSDLSLEAVVAALGLDPQAVAQRFIADAVGAEVLRIRREIEAAGVVAVH